MKKEYKNELGQYHRLDGPAIENDNGSKSWYLNGIEYTEEEYSLRESHRVTTKTN